MPSLAAPNAEATRRNNGAEAVFAAATLINARLPEGALAVATIRADTKKGFAWLPNFHDNRVVWVETLLQEWAESDREAFKAVVPWREQRDWLTNEELALSEELNGIAEERGEVLALLTARQAGVETALAEAGRVADRGPRRLLTQSGENLVEAASEALSILGFQVQHMDVAKAPGQPKLEDLRITCALIPGWEALVEVKGHEKRGLRLADVNQVRRPRERYWVEKQRWPDLVLVVHNGHALLPPSSRPRPFDTSPDDAEAIVDEGFLLVVPTTDLFRLVRASASLGDAALRLLVDSRGIFSFHS